MTPHGIYGEHRQAWRQRDGYVPGCTDDLRKMVATAYGIRAEPSHLAVLWDAGTGPYQRDSFLAATRSLSHEATVIEYRGGATFKAGPRL